MANQLWRPVLTFENTLNIERLANFGGKFENAFWFKRPNMLDFSEILKVTISCNFDFGNYPFDYHLCLFNLQDIKYDLTDGAIHK